MAKGIEKRIKESFGNGNHDDIQAYIGWLRETIADLSQSVRRNVAILLLLIAIFILIDESPKSVVTLAGFQIDKQSLIFQFVPVLAAYFFLQAMVDTSRLSLVRRAMGFAFFEWSSNAAKNDLELLVQSPLPLYWKTDMDPGETYSIVDKVDSEISSSIGSLFCVGVAAFEGWAFFVLYRASNHHLISPIISGVVSAFFYILAFIYFAVSPKGWNNSGE